MDYLIRLLNLIYELVIPPKCPLGCKFYYWGFPWEIDPTTQLEVLSTKFGKYEILNLDTGEVRWQNNLEWRHK